MEGMSAGMIGKEVGMLGIGDVGNWGCWEYLGLAV